MVRILLTSLIALGTIAGLIDWLRVWSVFGDGPWPDNWSPGVKLVGLVLWIALMAPVAFTALMIRTGAAHIATKLLELRDRDTLGKHPSLVAKIFRRSADFVGLLWMAPSVFVLVWLGSL